VTCGNPVRRSSSFTGVGQHQPDQWRTGLQSELALDRLAPGLPLALSRLQLLHRILIVCALASANVSAWFASSARARASMIAFAALRPAAAVGSKS